MSASASPRSPDPGGGTPTTAQLGEVGVALGSVVLPSPAPMPPANAPQTPAIISTVPETILQGSPLDHGRTEPEDLAGAPPNVSAPTTGGSASVWSTEAAARLRGVMSGIQPAASASPTPADGTPCTNDPTTDSGNGDDVNGEPAVDHQARRTALTAIARKPANLVRDGYQRAMTADELECTLQWALGNLTLATVPFFFRATFTSKEYNTLVDYHRRHLLHRLYVILPVGFQLPKVDAERHFWRMLSRGAVDVGPIAKKNVENLFLATHSLHCEAQSQLAVFTFVSSQVCRSWANKMFPFVSNKITIQLKASTTLSARDPKLGYDQGALDLLFSCHLFHVQDALQQDVWDAAKEAAGIAPLFVHEKTASESHYGLHHWVVTFDSLGCPPQLGRVRRLVIHKGDKRYMAMVHNPRGAYHFPCSKCLSVKHLSKACVTTNKAVSMATSTMIVDITPPDTAIAVPVSSKFTTAKEVLLQLDALRKLHEPALHLRLATEAAEKIEKEKLAAETAKKERTAADEKEKKAKAEEQILWAQKAMHRRALQVLMKDHLVEMQAAKMKKYSNIQRVINERARMIKARAYQQTRASKQQTADRTASTENTAANTAPTVAPTVAPPSPKALPSSPSRPTPATKRKAEMIPDNEQTIATSTPPLTTPTPPQPVNTAPMTLKVKPQLSIDPNMPVRSAHQDTPRPDAQFSVGQATPVSKSSTPDNHGSNKRASIRSTSRSSTPGGATGKTNRPSPATTRRTPKNQTKVPMPFIPISTAFAVQETPHASESKSESQSPPSRRARPSPQRPSADTPSPTAAGPTHATAASSAPADAPMPDAERVLSPRKRERPVKSPKTRAQDPDGDAPMAETKSTGAKKREKDKPAAHDNQSDSDSDDFEPAHLQPSFHLLKKQLASQTRLQVGGTRAPPVVGSVAELSVATTEPTAASSPASSLDSSQDCVLLPGRPETWPDPRKSSFDSQLPIFKGQAAMSCSPTSSAGPSQDADPLLASPHDFGPEVKTLADWQERFGARVIDNVGDGRCLQRAMDGALRPTLPTALTHLGTGKFSTQEAFSILHIGESYFLAYFPQMVADGTIQPRALHKRYRSEDSPELNDTEIAEEIIEHVWKTLSYPRGTPLPKSRWSGAEELMGIVWYLREPVFVIGADNHVQVYIIEQAPARSPSEEVMVILPFEDADAWAMIQTIINHRVTPRVLVHSGSGESGHWQTFRFPEQWYAEWRDPDITVPGDERRKDRLDLALHKLGLYVAVAKPPLPLAKRDDSFDFSSQESDSSYVPSSADSQEPRGSSQPTVLTLSDEQNATLHASLNPKLRLRSPEQALWRTAERLNLRALRSGGAPGSDNRDLLVSADAMTAALERRVPDLAAAITMLRRLPFPFVALAARPVALVNRLGRAVADCGGGLRTCAWMSDLKATAPDRIALLTDGTNIGRCTLSATEEALFLKMIVALVLAIPEDLPTPHLCIIAHAWTYSNAADARQLLVRLRDHQWSTLTAAGEQALVQRTTPALSPTAEEAER